MLTLEWVACCGAPPPQYRDRPEILSGQANAILNTVATGVNYNQPYEGDSCSRSPLPVSCSRWRRAVMCGHVSLARGAFLRPAPRPAWPRPALCGFREVKVKALQALANSLQYVSGNFEQDVRAPARQRHRRHGATGHTRLRRSHMTGRWRK